MRDKMKNPNFVLCLGMLFLVLAAVATWFLHPTAQLGDGITDGVKGLLDGLAIGFMLLSVYRRSHSKSTDC